jgi:hypothetical protein
LCGVHWRQRLDDACRRRAGVRGYMSRKGDIGGTSGGEALAARLGEGNSAAHLARPAAERRDSETATRRASKGSAQALRLGGGRALRPTGPTAVH